MVRRQDLESAQQLFERALTLDGEFALGYPALAEAHGRVHWNRYDPSPGWVEQLHVAATMAGRLAPELPRARMATGLWHLYVTHDYRAGTG